MKEKKNIDRLFQEQLKDFEVTPNHQVWQNIEAELNRDKKKRRPIPLWLQYSGIAAALFLGVFILKSVPQKDLTPANSTFLKGLDTNQTRSANGEGPLFKKNLKTIQKDKLVTKKVIPSKNYSNQNGHNTTPNQTLTNNKNTLSLVQNNTILYLKNNPKTVLQESQLTEKNSKITKEPIETSIYTRKNNVNTEVLDESIVNVDKTELTANTPEETNALEAILKSKNDKKTELATVSKERWQITPNIAPVYLNTKSGGSAIDNQFSNNEKTAEKSLSYGLGINYAINSKITIRTGINKVVLGYNTNDIAYSPGLATNSIATINYRPNNAVEIKNEASFNTLTSTEKNIQNTTTGAINQTMGYYEFPLEVSYSLLDKKFGISLIGGFSTLFLNENKISLVSSQSSVKLGEANNLNEVHLSSNFGMGFKYQLIPSVHFHFEPTIKYQMNTFSGESNNFKPVFLGLYSGVSYRF